MPLQPAARPAHFNLTPGIPARLSPAADRVQPTLRPYQQSFAHERRRRLRHLVERVYVQQLELLARRYDERLALFAQEEKSAVVGPGGGREGRRRRVNPRLVSLLPGLGVEALFGATDERLTLRHDAGSGAGPYIQGTLLAIRKVRDRVGLIRGLDKVME